MIDQYVNFVNSHDPFTDEEMEKVLGKPPRASVYDSVIRPKLLATSVGAKITGKNLWNNFKNMKCELINIWLPPFLVDKSGENMDD